MDREATDDTATVPTLLKMRGLTILDEAYEALRQGSAGQEERLAEAARLLWHAYEAGAKEPAVVWPLKQLWTDTGHLDRVIMLLKDYLGVTPSAEERFLAGHYIVDTYALMRADTEAVTHHRRYIAELGPAVPAWRRLWSLADATMMWCWWRSGHIAEWLGLSLPLLDAVLPSDDASRRAIAYYLRTLSLVREQQGDLDAAIACAYRIVALYEGDASLDARRLTGDAFCQLIQLYDRTGHQSQQAEAVRAAQALVGELIAQQPRADPDPGRPETADPEAHRWTAYTVCHNLACALMWVHRYAEAASLFEQALTYADVPLTRFFYAGVVLAARGDRHAALEHLRRSTYDPRSSLVHRFEQAFREHECFASVHDDPEFLAVVQEGTTRYNLVGALE